MTSLFPIADFDQCALHDANRLLVAWGHRIGALERGNSGALGCYVLRVHGRAVAVACTSSLIRETVGGLPHLNRGNTVELSRLCAAEPWACRVALRLWRESVFPGTGAEYAVSYQDADLHTGNTYRFDGWTRAAFSASGTDQRTGRKGRRKWIWIWRRPAATATKVAA